MILIQAFTVVLKISSLKNMQVKDLYKLNYSYSIDNYLIGIAIMDLRDVKKYIDYLQDIGP